MSQSFQISAVALVAVATVAVGALGLRRAHRTSDFYVASRAVSPRWNAAAISGEYLSAASYLGIAGLILAYGVDMLWYPVGYTAGYLVLLALVAAPLRRSGAYTLPDFAEIRFGSLHVRRVASLLVVLIGWLYLLPQLQGAGLTLSTQTDSPNWLGGLVVCAVVLTAVYFGGMRSITFAQAFQFWLKLTALMIPAIVLVIVWRGDHGGTTNGYPVAVRTTVVEVKSVTAVQLPVTSPVTIDGTLDGQRVDGRVTVAAGEHRLGPATTVTLQRGDVIPVIASLPALTNRTWASPLGSGRPHPLYANLSLILAICLGTMGLPHVLVRFYTNPTGQDTRRAAVIVIMLLSVFYLFPTVLGALGRRLAPDLLLTGQTDATVLLLPERLVGGLGGQLLAALVTAGAFAAFLSTASGLTVSVAGVISQDVPWAHSSQVRAFRAAAVPAIAVPYLLSLPSEHLGLAAVVGLAFAVAASTFCPLLVLGIWWRGLTSAGAVTGLVVGGLLAIVAVIVTITVPPRGGWPAALLAEPAAWVVPIAFVVMVSVSMATRRSVPADVAMIMVRLHAPESLDVERGVSRPTVPESDQLAVRIDRSATQNDRLPQYPAPPGDVRSTVGD